MRWIVRSSRALGAAAVFSMLVAGAALAQGVTTGAIAGKVTDPQGQPVAEAAVQVVHRGTGPLGAEHGPSRRGDGDRLELHTHLPQPEPQIARLP